jgi:hypothetical protein
MEAMHLAKPVIATSWSGNMSFMDHSNACLVGYKLVPVQASMWVYSERVLGKSAVWAEPNVGEAADWMRVLVEQPDVRTAIGRKAAEDMRCYQQEAQRARFVDELRAILKSEVLLGIGSRRRQVKRMRLKQCVQEEERRRRSWLRRVRPLVRRMVVWKGY